MKKFKVFTLFVFVLLFTTTPQYIKTVSAKEIKGDTFENSIRLLASLENNKIIQYEDLQDIHPSKLVEEPTANNKADNSVDDIHKLLAIDSRSNRDDKPTRRMGTTGNYTI